MGGMRGIGSTVRVEVASGQPRIEIIVSAVDGGELKLLAQDERIELAVGDSVALFGYYRTRVTGVRVRREREGMRSDDQTRSSETW